MPAALAATGIQPKPYHNLSSGAEDSTNVKHIINKSKEKNIFFYCLLFEKQFTYLLTLFTQSKLKRKISLQNGTGFIIHEGKA